LNPGDIESHISGSMEPLSPVIFKKKKSLNLVNELEEDNLSKQEQEKLENAFLSPRP